jgi:hypothetical protein
MYYGGTNAGSAGPSGMHEGTARSGPGANMAPVTLNVNTSANNELYNLSISLRGNDKLLRYSGTTRKNTIMLGDLVFRLVNDHGVPISGVFSDFSNLPVPCSVMNKNQLSGAEPSDATEWLYNHIQFVGIAKEPITHTDGGLSVGAINGLAPNTGVATVFINGTVKILADSRTRIRPSQWLIFVLPDAIESSRITKYSRNVARLEPVPDDVFQRLVRHSRFSAFDEHYFRFLTKSKTSAYAQNPFAATHLIGNDVKLGSFTRSDTARYNLAKSKSGFYNKSMASAFLKGFALIHALNAQGLLKIETVAEKKRRAIGDYVGNQGNFIDKSLMTNLKISTDDEYTFDTNTYTIGSGGFELKTVDRSYDKFIQKSQKKENLKRLIGLFKHLEFKSAIPLHFLETANGMHAYACMGNLNEDDLNDIFSLGHTSQSLKTTEIALEARNFLAALRKCDDEVAEEYHGLSKMLQSRLIGHSLYASEGNPSEKPILDDNADNPHVFMSVTGASVL